jgi:Bacterial Ig-like domain (group 2)
MGSRVAAAVCLLAAALVAGCSNSTTPPTPVTRAAGLTISGLHSLEEGETAALTLTVRLSTGESKTVADGVTWSSENPSTATVTASGVVTAVATGSAGIRAAFEGISTTATLTVSPGPRTFSGFVHEAQPTETVGIAGATIVVLDAKGVTQSIVSDAGGRFSVRLPIGSTRFTLTASGYEVSDRSTDIGADSAPLSLALLPAMREVREYFGQPWAQWNGQTLPGGPFREVSFSIVTHNPGTIRMAAEACVRGCLASEMALFCAEIRDGSNRVVASARGQYDLAPDIPNIQTKGGERYQVKVGVCPGLDATYMMNRFSIEVKHPS